MKRPLFIETRSGRLFTLYWPSAQSDEKFAFLHIPAFAEEMNKARRMVNLQAQALAEQGHAVVVFDLFGTGDSAGEFGEASWSIWLNDIADMVRWLQQQGYKNIVLWGLRIGGLLALDFIKQNPGLINRLLAWQPVLIGDTFVTQFLRLRVAAAMMNNQLPAEKASDLKQQLQSGRHLEVAGYQLNPALIMPLLTLTAESLLDNTVESISIFDWVAEESSEPGLSAQKFFNACKSLAIDAELLPFTGANFWTSQEITVSPALLSLTSDLAAKWQ